MLTASELESWAGWPQSVCVTQAFILGAGLGTRLRPLTGRLPKPLVPLYHRPLAAWALDACARAGIRSFAINTHHLPEAWRGFVAQPEQADFDITLFHEPVLLETGGGLKNIAAWMDGQPLLVHNGDIFSSLPLERLIAAHKASGLPVTLALRSDGVAKHIAVDAASTRVIDIRGGLGRAQGSHVFTGIYCVNPEFLELIPPQEIVSVIPAFLELARQEKLGAIVLDEGVWLDLGDREAYLKAHHTLALAPALDPQAEISAEALVENSVVGPGAIIEAGARVRDCVIWPGCKVPAGASLDNCVVFSGTAPAGCFRGVDL